MKKRVLSVLAAALVLLLAASCSGGADESQSTASPPEGSSLPPASGTDFIEEIPTSPPEFDVSARTLEDFPAKGTSYVSSMGADIELIADIHERSVYLYAVRNPGEDAPCGAVVRVGDSMSYYNWDILNKYLTDAAQIACADYDGDGDEELAVVVLAHSENNRYIERLRVIEIVNGKPEDDLLYDSDAADAQLRTGMNFSIAEGRLTLTYEASTVSFDVTKFLTRHGSFVGISEFGNISKFNLGEGTDISASFGVGLIFSDGESEGEIFCSDADAKVTFREFEFILSNVSLRVYDKY